MPRNNRLGRVESGDIKEENIPFERLRHAIIMQAVKDLSSTTPRIRANAERWFRSYPDIVPDAITERIIKELIDHDDT